MGANYDFAVARFDSTGHLDASFGTGGVATQNIIGSNADFASAITIESNGRIVLAGKTQPSPSSPSSQANSAFAAFTSTGMLDTSFNGTGVVFTTVAADFATAITHDASDNIVAVGQTAVVSATHAELITITATGGSVTRNTVNLSIPGSGSGDVANDVVPAGTKFRSPGRPMGSSCWPKSIRRGISTPRSISAAASRARSRRPSAPRPDPPSPCKATAGSSSPACRESSGHDFFAVARYQTNGTLDTGAFGSPNGYVMTDFTGSDSDSSIATGAVIEPDGKIIVAGTTNIHSDAPGDFAVARYIVNDWPTIATHPALLRRSTPTKPAARTLGTRWPRC